MKTRTIVLCVSEMSPVLVRKWVDAGVLENIAGLMARGVAGRTRYEVPFYLTPQMWATITTGVSAGRHGVFDYYQRDQDGKVGITDGSVVAVPRFWDRMAERGVRPGVVNLPLTYPPRLHCGFMISGQDAPGDHVSIAKPEAFYHELRKRFGRYHLKDVFPGGQDKESYAALLSSEAGRQTEVFEAIAARDDWDFLMLYTSGIAMAQHYFWAHLEADEPRDPNRHVVRDAFLAVDRMVQTISAAAGPDANVFVVSECGAGRLAKGVNLNAYLRHRGFLTFKSTATTARTARRIERGLLTSIRARAQRHLPKRFFYWANRSPLKKWIQNRLASGAIDWLRTRAYHRGKGEGNIYFNMAGREPQGVVTEMERAALAKEVEASLLALEDEGGERPVVAVHRREKLYAGPFLEYAPDMIVEWRDAAYMPTERNFEDEAIFGPRWREYMYWPTTGSHRPHGFFAAAGPDVSKRGSVDDIGLLDLAPTWLALSGLEVPPEMEGRARQDLLSDAPFPTVARKSAERL
ncbi:MAG TPA: alkaline phosphatase family protein [Verrucomicrobiota bacterium]|nr:alkaline phosphatase family protein [Verrucomicrobiota bacterium]